MLVRESEFHSEELGNCSLGQNHVKGVARPVWGGGVCPWVTISLRE